jgi:hypothetical protein
MKIILILYIFILIPSIVLSFSGKGSGTKKDPYQITNVQELQEVNNDWDACYILLNDIDASDTRNWNIGNHDRDSTTPNEPMGFKPIYFNGFFDGNGYIISNLYINRPRVSYIGFIEYLFGYIKKLGIENCDIIGCDYVGGLCGKVEIDETEVNKIEECYTTGKITVTDTSFGYGGGFCGNIVIGKVRNCFSKCIVNSSTSYNFQIASFSNGSSYSLEKCYSIGKVNVSAKTSVFGPEEKGNNCFWDIETTGVPDSGGHYAKGLPTSEMMKRSTYENAGWDFDSIWCIDEGKDYPKLRCFNKCAGDDVPYTPNIEGYTLTTFPNPAAEQLTIKFNAGNTSNVELFISDMYGIKVRNVINNEALKAGVATRNINLSGLSSGIYFVSLRTDSGILVNKFMVIK